MECPNNHGNMILENIRKDIDFRDETLTINVEQYKCNKCEFKGGTLEQISKIQFMLADAYRKKVNRLTSKEIINMRKQLGLSQKQFSSEIEIGIASIKRWETGIIQSRSMDKIMRLYFDNATKYTGNREFSIPRVKLVILTIESLLNKELLFNDSKFLFTAKYLWYADMIAFRDLDRSMTGATYAALPLGPQLNNYNELVKSIRESDEESAETLSDDEINILVKIVEKFPKKYDVKRATHNEKIWINKYTGYTIPYTDAKHIEML